LKSRLDCMKRVFEPESVAFVGASNNLGKWGGLILRNLVRGGYEGAIYPVNPKEAEIQGMKAYRSVSDVPGPVDLAMFTIPAAAMPAAISDCVKKGVPAGVVVSAGFGELGAEGSALEREMVRRARKGGMVLVGPNGQGIAVPRSRLYPWMPSIAPAAGSIGIASQSGNVSTVLCGNLAEFGYGVSAAISAGNCADLSWPDYLEFFRQDPNTRVVLLYIEGVTPGFFEAARKTALEKPVVVVKSGRTQAGASAVSTHTGVLAGSDEVFSAACRQAGVIRSEGLMDATIVSAGLVNTPLPRGPRLAMVTGGGGFGVMAADAAVRMGLTLPRLSADLIKKLQAHLPPWWSPNNPVDMVAGLGYGGPREIIPIIMESDEFDGVILLGVGWMYYMLDTVGAEQDFKNPSKKMKTRIKQDLEYCDLLVRYSKEFGKPLLVTSTMARLAVRRGYPGLVKLLDEGVMLYPEIEDATRTFAALAERRAFLEREGVL